MAKAIFRGISAALMVMAVFVFMVALRVVAYPSFFIQGVSAEHQFFGSMIFSATSVFLWNVFDEKGGKA